MVLCASTNAGSVVGYHEVVETLKLYLMQKNLLELSALTGGREAKTKGMSTCDHLLKLSLFYFN